MQFCHISGFSSFWAVLSVTGHLSGLEIKSHKHAARLIPHDEFSPDIVLYLAKDPSLLRYIPEYKMTEEAAYEAVSHSLLMEDGVKLAYIPERLLTKKVCERAFETNMDAL